MRPRDVFTNLATIETDRLLLRPLNENDAEDLYEYARDPEMARYVTWDTYRSIDDAFTFLGDVLSRQLEGKEHPWGLILKSDGKLVGTIGYGGWNLPHRRAEIAYALARRHWGQGLMTEAVRRAIRFGFEEMDLNRVEARCLTENAASARVMEKCGMRFEGVLRQHLLAKGRFHDVKLHAILRNSVPPPGQPVS